MINVLLELSDPPMSIYPITRRLQNSTASLNTMISCCLQRGQLEAARQLFDVNPAYRDVRSWNAIIGGYVKSDQFHAAQKMFDEMPVRDIVSWNTMLSGFQKSQSPKEAYHFYLKLRESTFQPSEFTLSILITTILGGEFSVLVPQLHGQSFQIGLNSSVFVASALMRGYTCLRDFSALYGVFDDTIGKDVISWNALILGCMELGLTCEAQRFFAKMPTKNEVSWTTMVNGYLRNKEIAKARALFDQMDQRNVVSWTVMISGYVQNEFYSDALELFTRMMESGTQPSEFTFSIILDACAGCSSLLTGKQLHASIIKHGTPVDAILSSSIIDMYAKCGDIEAAHYTFNSLDSKSLPSWNSLIGGLARHGFASRALHEFEKMVSSGVRPDEITLVNVLSACVHGGFVEKGENVFGCMEEAYGVRPDVEHYTCMVDLYGKAGQLEKAERLIKEMKCEPDVVVWGALLGACGLHSDFEVGRSAAEAISNLERDHPSIYSVLFKMLGEKEMWSNVVELRNTMKQRKTKKQKAGSWIS